MGSSTDDSLTPAMRERVLADRDVRKILISGGTTTAIVLGIVVVFVALEPERAGRLVPVLAVVAGIPAAIAVAVAVRVRYLWRGLAAIMAGFAVVLAVLAFVPLFEWTLAGRAAVLFASLIFLVFGYLGRRW